MQTYLHPGTPSLAPYTVAEAFIDLEVVAALRGIDAKANAEKKEEETKAAHRKASVR
jgi:hypothetical protein